MNPVWWWWGFVLATHAGVELGAALTVHRYSVDLRQLPMQVTFDCP